MIELRELRLAPDEKESRLRTLAAKALRINKDDVTGLKILRKSLDARKKSDVHWLYTVAVSVENENAVLSRAKNKKAGAYAPDEYILPSGTLPERPVVVGFGPAGIFAALALAEAGARPIVLERGADVDSRRKAVEAFWNGGRLDEATNVQFGEGGAGTFSDGKLNTGTRDRRIAFVLRTLHRFGAPEKICYDAKPHVGTDILSRVVKNIREHIISLGGEVRFCSRFSDFETENGILSAITVEGPEGSYRLECSRLILATGHSARDTVEYLHSAGLDMERKAFSMGVRIEHLQSKVGRCQYGQAAKLLPAADYKLNVRLADGRGVYSFCMCPGGYVVAAAGEAGGVCTNGMSYSGRSGENANAALLVGLEPEDFPGDGVLAGMYWQRETEQRAYACGGGNYLAPAQKVGDFLADTASAGAGGVQPTYRPGVVWGDLRQVLPPVISDALAQALPLLAHKAEFFADPEAVLTAPETRSSSPVRILRGADFMSSVPGIMPCGEGAGYAGGITSAAVDGLRCAEKILEG